MTWHRDVFAVVGYFVFVWACVAVVWWSVKHLWEQHR